MTVKITRTEFSAEELRRKAGRVRDANQSRRLLALASILDGACRDEAARNAGMDRQTLRDWVHRYNAEGVEGLLDRPRSGRKPRLNEDQPIQFDKIVEKQPDPVADGVVRWRCADLKEKIAKRFGVALSERSVGRILNERGFRKLSARPKASRAVNGELCAEALKQTSPERLAEIAFPNTPRQADRSLVPDAMRQDTALADCQHWQASATRSGSLPLCRPRTLSTSPSNSASHPGSLPRACQALRSRGCTASKAATRQRCSS